jgi:hypothetical protein
MAGTLPAILFCCATPSLAVQVAEIRAELLRARSALDPADERSREDRIGAQCEAWMLELRRILHI